MARKLENYLRTYRKSTGLSQDEVAFLVGCESGAEVSRHERFSRRPPMEGILAYEVIFGAPARDLFAGARHKVEEATRQRAALLAAKLGAKASDPTAARKLDVLRSIAAGPAPQST